MKNTKLKIEWVSIQKLNPAPYNPRHHSEKAIKDLTESLKRFGNVDPLVVNCGKGREDIIIGGHMRLKCMKNLGYEEVPVVYVNLSNIKREKELNLRLNRNQGEFDLELLKDFDVDLLLDIGFDDSDLSAIWDENLSIDDDDFDEEKELEKIKSPQSKTGDLFKFGQHRLLCGDATQISNIKNLIGESKIDIYNLDPPYNITLDYNKGIGGKKNYGGKTNDNKTSKEYHLFLKTIFQNCLQFKNSNCHFFCWNDENHIGIVQQLFEEVGVHSQRVCLWIKNGGNPTPQIAFNKVYEPCVYGVIGKPYLNPSFPKFTELLSQEIENGNRCLDDIMDIFNIWLCKRIDGNEYEHPTQKPPSLYEKSLKRCSKPGDLVFEAFGGSGSLLIACEQLNRKCYMTEIEPIFCDLIIRHWEQLTGKKAVLIKNVLEREGLNENK